METGRLKTAAGCDKSGAAVAGVLRWRKAEPLRPSKPLERALARAPLMPTPLVTTLLRASMSRRPTQQATSSLSSSSSSSSLSDAGDERQHVALARRPGSR